MRTSRLAGPSVLLASLLLNVAVASAQTPDQAAAEAIRQEIDQLKKDFEARLAGFESRLAALESSRPAPAAPSVQAPQTAEVPAGAQGAGGPSGALPIYGNATAASKIFNPDIAVIGNFLGAAGKNVINPEPALQLPETELSLQAVVDPYARADFFVSFGEEGVGIEEGFITFPTLPWGMLAKVGRMRAAFGKVNTLHTHIIPWTDRPLVTDNLVGGEEGIADAGISVSAADPESMDLPRSDWTGVPGRLGGRLHVEQARRPQLRWAPAWVSRHHRVDKHRSRLLVCVRAQRLRDRCPCGRRPVYDGLVRRRSTFRWRPLQRSIYRSFVGRSEFVWSRRDQPGGLQNSAGFYVSGDYQLGRRWFTGVPLRSFRTCRQ